VRQNTIKKIWAEGALLLMGGVLSPAHFQLRLWRIRDLIHYASTCSTGWLAARTR
jgi:hypothetical protein